MDLNDDLCGFSRRFKPPWQVDLCLGGGLMGLCLLQVWASWVISPQIPGANGVCSKWGGHGGIWKDGWSEDRLQLSLFRTFGESRSLVWTMTNPGPPQTDKGQRRCCRVISTSLISVEEDKERQGKCPWEGSTRRRKSHQGSKHRCHQPQTTTCHGYKNHQAGTSWPPLP